MNYTEDDLLYFISLHNEHEAYYREQLGILQAANSNQEDGR